MRQWSFIIDAADGQSIMLKPVRASTAQVAVNKLFTERYWKFDHSEQAKGSYKIWVFVCDIFGPPNFKLRVYAGWQG